MKNRSVSIILGCCCIIGAVLYLGNQLEWWTISLAFDGWWTMFIFAAGINSMIKEGIKGSNIFVIGIATLLLLWAQDVIEWHDMGTIAITLLLIVIGFSLIFQRRFDRDVNKYSSSESYSENEKYTITSIFTGNDVTAPLNTKSVEATAVFGGAEIDLRSCQMTSDIYVNAVAIFGGIDITVPKDVAVRVNPVGIFGGTDSKVNVDVQSKYTIYINTTAIFGGVDIIAKN